MSLINGFLVVRLPCFNKDFQGGHVAYSAVAPQIDTIYYGGVDRMAWFDINEEYYENRLPSDILELRENVEKDNYDNISGIRLTQDYDIATKLLRYSNKTDLHNELIVVTSPILNKYKKVFEWTLSDIDWLGYDVMGVGEWSLLADGLFLKPALFAEWQNYLNDYGLFDTNTIINDYIKAYLEAAQKQQVEELADNCVIDVIRIGRLSTND